MRYSSDVHKFRRVEMLLNIFECSHSTALINQSVSYNRVSLLPTATAILCDKFTMNG
jgi:hypothetical protein